MKVISNLILDFNSDDYINKISNNYDKYCFKRVKKLWENPYYYFRIPYNDKDGVEKYREIVIDVSLSAWSKEISPDYKKVLTILLSTSSAYKINSVLDFGSGKLNSVNFILRRNKKITIVDFKEILDKYNYLNDRLKDLEKNKKFKKMEFPNPFINNQSKFDLGLIANVLPFMPVFLERLYVLQILHQKIRQGKFLLWYAITNPSAYRKRKKINRYNMGDGIWLRKDIKKHQTFYNYHPIDYLNLIMYLSGFHFERTFKTPAVDSLLFKNTNHNLLNDIITNDLLEKTSNYQMIIKDSDIKKKSRVKGEINPCPENYNLFNIIKTCLENIEPGKTTEGHPNKFKRIAAGIINYIFFNQLYDMEIEEEIHEGRGIVDITFRPTGSDGFFKSIRKIHSITCPIVFVEVKNKKGKLENPEYRQLYDRFGPLRGMFGILVCRDKVNEKEVLKQLSDRKKIGYAVVLDDNDLLNLLKIKLEDGENPINQFFEKKITKLLMI